MLRSQSGPQGGTLNIDGAQWSTRSPGFAGSTINTVLCCDRELSSYPETSGIYLAAGEAGKLFRTSTTVKSYNIDSAWTSTTSSFGTTAIYGGHQGGGDYTYLVGAAGKIARTLSSGAHSSWTQVTSSFDLTTVFDITGDQWLYVAVGSDGKIATKNDYAGAVTADWTQRANPFGTSFIYSVTVRPGSSTTDARFVAVGQDGLIATWDTRGIYAVSDAAIYTNSWVLRTSPFGTSDIRSVSWSGRLNKFVAVGEDGKIASSDTGVEWTLAGDSTFGSSPIYAVTSTGPYGDIFVAAGADGKLATSSDGSTWTSRTSGFSGAQIIYALDGNSTTGIAGGDAGLVSLTPIPQTITTPVVPPPPPLFVPRAATGGTVSDVPNYNGSGVTWRIHTYTSSGSFNVTGPGDMTCLAVGGGGGGHGGSAGIFGSGGYGGQVVPLIETFSVGAYTIVVGPGGTGGAYQGAPSGTGGTSSITGTGVAINASGGAGRSAGENAQDGIGASGSGRNGISSDIVGAFYGYGGGGGYALNVGNRGFVDGGGPGGDVSVNLGSPGQANTGGGGGGSYNSSNPGRDGGTGVVIIAYPLE
jgi:hypothetical protein